MKNSSIKSISMYSSDNVWQLLTIYGCGCQYNKLNKIARNGKLENHKKYKHKKV